jgi:divalent metal cation (Fe/Co/Zn/Cd) transporter
LPEDEESIVELCVEEHLGPMGEAVGFHKLRTRKSGSERYVELHLVMAAGDSIEKAHSLCDHLEDDIKSKLPNVHVTIHVEPCDHECDECPGTCPPPPPAP